MSEVELRTAAWYGDRLLLLPFPKRWQIRVFWPDTPTPLAEDAIADSLERPVEQPPIRELARGKSRPLVIVDDLTRPTPADRIMPYVLRQFADAGISAGSVTIMLATGAHGPASREAIEKKVGSEAARSCRVLTHDHRGDMVKVGQTSFGTPVVVNREVAQSDLLVGVGGIYPQHSTGFGGGSKLALGVLGTRSIKGLHYGHLSMQGSYEIENDFRRDLDEVAQLIRLETTISLHLDSDRGPVRVVSGDHRQYYRDEVEFARRAYRAPAPGDANVVISNAYPIDVSLTFMQTKGMIPVLDAAPPASRIILSACPEGVGHHALYPFFAPRFARARHLSRAALNAPRTLPPKVIRRLRSVVGPRRPQGAGSVAEVAHRNPIWIHPPGMEAGSLPSQMPNMRPSYSWREVLDRVEEEQGRDEALNVVIYPCAPLQVLDRPAKVEVDSAQGASLE